MIVRQVGLHIISGFGESFLVTSECSVRTDIDLPSVICMAASSWSRVDARVIVLLLAPEVSDVRVSTLYTTRMWWGRPVLPRAPRPCFPRTCVTLMGTLGLRSSAVSERRVESSLLCFFTPTQHTQPAAALEDSNGSQLSCRI